MNSIKLDPRSGVDPNLWRKMMEHRKRDPKGFSNQCIRGAKIIHERRIAAKKASEENTLKKLLDSI